MRLPLRKEVRAPQCQGVDRPDLQARRRVQETGTNSPSVLISPISKRKRSGRIGFSGKGMLCSIRCSRSIAAREGEERSPVAMARWSHPFPSRTRLLSTAAAKIVGPERASKIARRRAFFFYPPMGVFRFIKKNVLANRRDLSS